MLLSKKSSVESPSIIIETLKAAYDGRGVVVRLFQARNTLAETTLTFSEPIHTAEQCDLEEKLLKSIEFSEPELQLTLQAFEICTLRIVIVQK